MKNRRLRFVVRACIALAAVWFVVWAACLVAQNSRMTTAKISRFVNSIDLATLPPDARLRAIHDLADKVNALSAEDRRNWRREVDWKNWFKLMTEGERLDFIEATLPTGFKQMLDAFAEMPEDRRKRAIDDALKNLHDNSSVAATNGPADYGTNGPPPLSPTLERQVRLIGLKAYYSQSSAETKAELAPLVEEIERQLSAGRSFR